MLVKRTEQIWLQPNDDIGKLCHLSKNLYNEGNYMIRQEFFDSGKWMRYNKLAFMLKTSRNYKEISAQTAQQILKVLDRNWRGFFNAIKEWKKHPERFQERPRIPHYKKKNGEFMLVFTNQQAKIKDGMIILPKKVSGVLGEIKTRIKEGLREIRIIPKAVGYVLELVYEKIIDAPKRDKSRIAGIDIGVRNLVTVVNNIGKKPIVVKGGVAKSINQFFNKEKAHIQSMYDLQGIKIGSKMKRLLIKKEKKMHDYLHKVSRRVIDYLVENDIGLLVIGHNANWKQNVSIGRRNNQNFVFIPFYKLIHMLKYKGEEKDIGVIAPDEDHTSKCSFFDGESVEHHGEYVGNRKRGLFRTAKGYVVNADVNAGLNIIKKAVPNAFPRGMADRIEDAVSHPLRLVVA